MISNNLASLTLVSITMLATPVMAELLPVKKMPPLPEKSISLPEQQPALTTGSKPTLAPKTNKSLPAGTRPGLLPKQNITLPKQKTALPSGAKPVMLPGRKITLPTNTGPKLLLQQNIALPKQKTALPLGARPALLPGSNRALPTGARPTLLPKQNISMPGSAKLNDRSRSARIDLGIQIIEARIPAELFPGDPRPAANEIEVEVVNHGSMDFDTSNFNDYASVKISVSNNGNDGHCLWPTNITKHLTGLKSGERKTFIFKRTYSPGCSYSASHNNLQVIARVDYDTRNIVPVDDPNMFNNGNYIKLIDLLRVRHTNIRKPVRIKLSSLALYVGKTGDSSNLRGITTGELKWVKVKLHHRSQIRYGHDQVSLLRAEDGNTQGRHKKNWLKIHHGDWLRLPGDVVATAYEGETVTLEIKARDLDCSGNNSCRRGTNGSVRVQFRVPRNATNFSDCTKSNRRHINELPEITANASSGPTLYLSGLLGRFQNTFASHVCFEQMP